MKKISTIFSSGVRYTAVHKQTDIAAHLTFFMKFTLLIGDPYLNTYSFECSVC